MSNSLLSPSHLLLATSGMLMVGGPIRAAGARLLDGAPRTWRTAGPVAIPLAMAVAILVAFTQYVNPVVDPWAEALPDDQPRIAPQLYAMAADGSGQRRLTVLPGQALAPRYSPDGTRIVYSYQPNADKAKESVTQLHVMNADGTDDHLLPTENDAFQAAWSPEGDRLAFTQNVDGQDDLFVMATDGSGLERLTNDAASDWAVVWTPDGSALLFNSDRDGTFHVHRFDLGTKAITSVTTGPSNDYEPAISPDGTRVAFTSDRRGDGHLDVWLTGIEGGEPTRFTAGSDDDVGDSYMAAWSPDGSKIAFASNRTDDFEVYVMPAAGGEAVNLSQSPGSTTDGLGRTGRPDGSSIVYPSESNVPFWRVDYIRQGFGAAGSWWAQRPRRGRRWLRRRYGSMPFGSYAIVIGAPIAMATVLDDQYRLLPAIVVATLAAELVVRRWPAGRSRVGDSHRRLPHPRDRVRAVLRDVDDDRRHRLDDPPVARRDLHGRHHRAVPRRALEGRAHTVTDSRLGGPSTATGSVRSSATRTPSPIRTVPLTQRMNRRGLYRVRAQRAEHRRVGEQPRQPDQVEDHRQLERLRRGRLARDDELREQRKEEHAELGVEERRQ